MGMLDGSPTVPMGDDYGASLGRGMGVASASDMPTTNGMLTAQQRSAGMSHDAMLMRPADTMLASGDLERMMEQLMMAGMQKLEVAPDANTVPNYPQDAFMEGPMMNMDAMVDKPENFGLPRGWSENMQGMMTFVRVLPPALYDEVMCRVAAARGTATPTSMPTSMPMPSAGSKPHKSAAQKPAAAPMDPAMKMDMPMPAPAGKGGHS